MSFITSNPSSEHFISYLFKAGVGLVYLVERFSVCYQAPLRRVRAGISIIDLQDSLKLVGLGLRYL